MFVDGIISHYAIEEALGEDNAGHLLRARDFTCDRVVVLRVIEPHVLRALPGLREHLEQMQTLDHPNLVELIEIDEVDDGLVVAMEAFAGIRLRDWLETYGDDWRRVLALFIDVGEGLAAAHGRGLVHLGFYGHELWIDRAGNPRVEGVGLYPGEVAPDSDYIWGNPTGMAPEQIRDLRIADARTDQFSYCFRLWESLHGERPFVGSSIPELLGRVCEGLISEPRDPAVPVGIREILGRGLEPDPGRRWPDMRALVDALRTAG